MDQLHAVERREIVGRASQCVVDLATDHRAGGVGEFAQQFEARVGGDGMRVRCQQEERVGQELVACEDGHGFAGVFVQRGLAAAEVVVVEGGEIIVDEAEAMDEFDGGAGEKRSFACVWACTCGGGAGVPGENGAQAFAGTESRVAHSFAQGEWAIVGK